MDEDNVKLRFFAEEKNSKRHEKRKLVHVIHTHLCRLP